jgi:hypothetical protein
MRASGAPFVRLEIPDQPAREIYGSDLILLRPDMHVVWRGNRLPADAGEIAAIATGQARTRKPASGS